jgi:hypothetical protein
MMKKQKSTRRRRARMQVKPSLLRPTRTVWLEGTTEQFLLATLRMQRFQHGRMTPPPFAQISELSKGDDGARSDSA